ncbi:MAG: maltokinase N-terminal cap-like domain-containing protein [Actinocrinis sp.]
MTSTIDLAPELDGRFAQRLSELLGHWLPEQRWFGGKGRPIASVALSSVLSTVGGGDGPGDGPRMWHVLVDVGYQDRAEGEPAQTYQVFVGVRRSLPDRLRHAAIGDPDEPAPELGGYCYDALHDAELAGWLLERLADRDGVGPLRFDRLAGQVLNTDLRALVLTGEQSNTSLVYGDQYIAKVFRRPAPGRNPELELGLALAVAESPHIAPPIGWAEFDGPDVEDPATLLTLQPFLPSATDGWQLALTSVRDLFGAEADISAARAGADFAPEAHRLGTATARVHRALAATLPTGWLEAQQLADVAAGMRRQLEVTARQVPQLRPYVAGLREAIDRLAALGGPLPVQRVHGDFHLGQAMRTVNGWILLDFEGEPARSLAERRAPASPLKDIAGMLRSFDYAAHHLLGTLSPSADEPPGSTELMTARATEWAGRNRDAFCRGYAEALGYDPRAEAAVLRAFEIDKAVYEVGYEAANRPTWLQIPLNACARLAGRG